MAKFRKHELSKKETEDLLLEFSIVLSQIKKPKEAVQFIQDIMSKSEARMLAKRLKIAELLLDENEYSKISRELKVSSSTIARVNSWLQASGEGYRTLLERSKKLRSKNDDIDVYQRNKYFDLKRRYPVYFWPQIVLESIVKNANEKQRNQIREAIDALDEKDDLYKHLSEIMRNNNHN